MSNGIPQVSFYHFDILCLILMILAAILGISAPGTGNLQFLSPQNVQQPQPLIVFTCAFRCCGATAARCEALDTRVQDRLPTLDSKPLCRDPWTREARSSSSQCIDLAFQCFFEQFFCYMNVQFRTTKVTYPNIHPTPNINTKSYTATPDAFGFFALTP